jgi:SEFIR domain
LSNPTAPKVFISYSHDSPEHQNRVLDFADRLRRDGIDAMIDQYIQSPPQGWPNWCDTEIRNADFVLMVCTETYRRRVDGEEGLTKGHGVLWEALLIKQYLYDSGSVNRKFVPILFADGLHEHVPSPVRGTSIYKIETEDGYEDLYRLLTDQPGVQKPDLGKLRRLRPRRRQWSGEPPNSAAPEKSAWSPTSPRLNRVLDPISEVTNAVEQVPQGILEVAPRQSHLSNIFLLMAIALLVVVLVLAGVILVPKPYVASVDSAFRSFASDRPTIGISVVGLLLLVSALALAVHPMRVTSSFGVRYIAIYITCLFLSIALLLTATGHNILGLKSQISELQEERRTIPKISTDQAFLNLGLNARISWLLRLIAFDPGQASLEVGVVPTLGNPSQKFIFVSNYDELRGYTVSQAYRMSGGVIRSKQHVSAIIFPLQGDLFPANARGLLQAINKIEQLQNISMPTPTFDVQSQIDKDEKGDLQNDDLDSWAFVNYKAHYRHYCELSQKFRLLPYAVKEFMGGIGKDWTPLGFSRKDTETLTLPNPLPNICDITSWEEAMREYTSVFGARVFFLGNLEINKIHDRYLIDFQDPDREHIPDIWNDRKH